MKKISKYFQYHLQNISYMLRNRTKTNIVASYLLSELKKLYFKYIYKNQINTLLLSIKNNFKLDDKFFSYERFYNILFIFISLKKNFNDNLKILEIGSFQGGTAIVLLNLFKKSNLEIVDTWSDDFIEGNKDYKEIKFDKVEDIFNQNMSKYRARVKKFKSSSENFFKAKLDKKNNQDKKYDIIYIDGSHKYEDVLLDAHNCLKFLNVNGTIIFDDFLWRQNAEPFNPINAINDFLNKEIGAFKIICVYHQLIIRKIK